MLIPKHFKAIYLNEQLGYGSSAKFLAELEEAKSTGQDIIPIVINSPGGCISELVAIADAITTTEQIVLTYVSGIAYSAAAAILALGDFGYRFASPRSEIMIHEAFSSFEGEATDAKNETEALKRANARYLELLAYGSASSSDYFKKLMRQNNRVDLYMTPYNARKHHLIDKVGVPNIETRSVLKCLK